MKLPILITLGVISAALLTGCATQKTTNGRAVNIGAGLVKVQTGSYQPPSPNTLVLNTNQMYGDMADTKGTETTILWGLLTLNGY